MSNLPLTEEETRHLRALKLFYEAWGHDDWAKKIDEAAPAVQRLAITIYHQQLEDPEAFGTAWKWSLRFYPVIRAYVRFKEKVTKIFNRC